MRQLILLAIIVAAYIFIKRLIRDALKPPSGGTHRSSRPADNRQGRHADKGEEMVQDPNCNTFVPVSRALTYKYEGRTLHFCSEDCANEYARKLKSGEL